VADTRIEGEERARAPEHQGAARSGHPSAKEYVRIALLLGVLTGIEIWLSYSGLPGGLQITLLLLGMLFKFCLVVLWFMHLKFDSRTYSRFFVMGLAGAVTLYLIVLISFRTFLR
jgi:caa(3)-type oxidase subunit IV